MQSREGRGGCRLHDRQARRPQVPPSGRRLADIEADLRVAEAHAIGAGVHARREGRVGTAAAAAGAGATGVVGAGVDAVGAGADSGADGAARDVEHAPALTHAAEAFERREGAAHAADAGFAGGDAGGATAAGAVAGRTAETEPGAVSGAGLAAGAAVHG